MKYPLDLARSSVKNCTESWTAYLAMAIGIACFSPTSTQAQGCVASRGAGVTASILSGGHALMMGEEMSGSPWEASVGYRWLHSDRHFTGSHEDVNRQEEGSQVINNSNFIDIGVTYQINSRFSVTAVLPFVVNDRSQVVRNAARVILDRFHTQSAGIGDVRVTGNAWLWDPATHHKGNLNVGLGVVTPTGEKDAKDTFQVFRAGQIVGVERTVDQSIQPGTGGWGITLELYGYQQIMNRLNAYVNGAYTITPQEKNGVPTFRSNPYEAIMSIGDSYMGRTGLEYMIWPKHAMTLSLGGRIDGVPVYDLVGGSNGFRRPGFSISIEPGISASVHSWSFNLTTPVAVYRNREQSVPDKQNGGGHGDAAFADFTVLFSLSKHF